jgi:hypothetical protein
VEKTTLTISGANAYVDAVLKDAWKSGRTILALQAEPDPRRSGSQTDTQTARQPAVLEDARSELGGTQESLEDPETGAEVQMESGTTIQGGLEPDDQEMQDQGLAGKTATWLDHPVISWNPASFASTKAALIEAETTLGGTVHEAIVFIDPLAKGKRLPDLSLGQIEAATTTWITGFAQLLRELGRRFSDQGSGLILVVLLPGERSPLGAMAAGAMEALACALASQTGEAYRILAVRDESGQPEMLARYILKILDEQPRDSTRLLRHGGRINLFGK